MMHTIREGGGSIPSLLSIIVDERPNNRLVPSSMTMMVLNSSINGKSYPKVVWGEAMIHCDYIVVFDQILSIALTFVPLQYNSI
jgi:hypothetical protein